MEKQEVIKVLAAESGMAQFSKLLSLFVTHPHHPQGVARFLNASGYTPENLKTLVYDIKKTFDISDEQIRSFAPPKPETDTAEKPEKNPYDGAKPEVKDGLKLRVEFPFLNNDDCPDKLKILVADKFTALKKYEDAHEEIRKRVAEGKTDELFALAKTAVENWELNQLIYDELHYYQDKKEILGNHPIFADEMLQKKVNAYSTHEVVKRQGNLRSYISRESKKLEKAKPENKAKIEAKIKEWQDELNLIDTRLNAAEKK